MHHGNFRGGGRMSPAPFCLLLALAALLCFPGVAAADHPNDTALTAVLGEKPSELEDVTVQVQDTQGPQLIVENTTGETLEIHDAEGVPFLRIGPAGVEANRKAKTFYETYGPEGVPVPDAAQEATDEEAKSSPDWTRVSEQRSWGWFDHRLQTEDMEVPEEISHAEQPTDFGSWEVPVKLGDAETDLEGSYRYEPEPKGTYVASTTSEPDGSEIITQLSQGYGGATALLLQNEGEDPVTVLDGSGNPAIEIGPDEVRVNTSSPVGREASRGIGEESAGSEGPQWVTVSGGSSFTWQDPRLSPPGGADQPPGSNVDQSQEVAQWEIPLESSGESYKIEGVIEWQPLQSESTTGSGESGHDHSSHDHSGHSHSGHDHSGDGSSHGEEDTSPVSAATIVPVAGLLVAASAGGALLYRRWRA